VSQAAIRPLVSRGNPRAPHSLGGRHLAKFASRTILLVAALIFMAPVIWALITSIKTQAQYSIYPIVWWPPDPQWQNYPVAIFDYPFLKYAKNTLYLATSSTVLTVFSSSLAGFAFARQNSPLKNLMFVLVLSMLMIPRMVTIVPTFMLFSRLHLTNTYWPWILWGASGSSYHIFLFRQFFSAIPKDLEDAAEVDGCGRFRIYWQIFLPNSGPVIATAAIFHFQWVWGDWFTPNIFLTEDLTTLGVKLARSYVDPHGYALIPLTLAAIFIYMLPMVIVFFLAQKYIIQGVVTSGLKG